MGGFPDEVYYSLYRIAQTLDELGTPWPDVQDAYLRAWEYMPRRCEPLFFTARRYRDTARYQLGYAFASIAACIPLPEGALQVRSDIYAWRATDELAVCASWIGKKSEAFTLWRRLLAKPDSEPDPGTTSSDHRRWARQSNGRIARYRHPLSGQIIESYR